MFSVTDTFLGKPNTPVPYVIGVAGSVAVGKSTSARVLQALLSRWPDHPRVDLVTTDGFLLPNAVLEERGLMQRKGFPESYDRRSLLEFVAALKSGAEEVSRAGLLAPCLRHRRRRNAPGQTARHPHRRRIECPPGRATGAFVSDYFDFSIYVDADPADIEEWYVSRFLTLRDTAFRIRRPTFIDT